MGLVTFAPRERYIYHVYRTDDSGYDETHSVVVIARDSKVARELAAGVAGDEGPGAWLPGRRSGQCRSKVRKLGDARVPNGYPAAERVIVRDFNAG